MPACLALGCTAFELEALPLDESGCAGSGLLFYYCLLT